MSSTDDDDRVPSEEPSVPDAERSPSGATHVEPEEGRTGRAAARSRLVALWRRGYGASPLHLLIHLAGIALCAYALVEVFGHYHATAGNLFLWLVAGAILNDFVAIPVYVGVDRLARTAWDPVRARLDRRAEAAAARDAAPESDLADPSGHGDDRDEDAAPPPARPRALLSGRGHVRFPVVMSATMLLVFLPNILHKAPRGHQLSTGLADQPDWAGRWLLITAGLLLASAVIYAIRATVAASAARRPSHR